MASGKTLNSIIKGIASAADVMSRGWSSKDQAERVSKRVKAGQHPVRDRKMEGDEPKKFAHLKKAL